MVLDKETLSDEVNVDKVLDETKTLNSKNIIIDDVVMDEPYYGFEVEMPDSNHGAEIANEEKLLVSKKAEKTKSPIKTVPTMIPLFVTLVFALIVSILLNAYFIFFTKDQNSIVLNTEGDNTPNVNTDTFPLIASVEDRSLFLYGIPPYGVVLVNNGVSNYFDWLNVSSNMERPEMHSLDVDRDGIEEIEIITKAVDETGENQHGIHILKFISNGENKPIYSDIGMDAKQTVELLKTVFDVEHDTVTGQISILTQNQTFPVDYVNTVSSRNYLVAKIGRSVEYRMDGSLVKANVSVDIVYDDGSYENIGSVELNFSYNSENLNIDKSIFIEAT